MSLVKRRVLGVDFVVRFQDMSLCVPQIRIALRGRKCDKINYEARPLRHRRPQQNPPAVYK